MFCPECRCEYIEGIKECSTCGVPLVEQLPPEIKMAPKSRLKETTLLAIIALSYQFALRATGTFLPDIFRIPIVAQVSQLLSLLADMSLVFFFVLFYRDYVREEQAALRKASVLAIIASIATALLKIKGLLLVFDVHVSPPLLSDLVRSHFLAVVVPWLGSILILVFFVVLYREMLVQQVTKLREAAFIAAIGALVGTLLLSFTLFSYFCAREAVFFMDLFRIVAIILMPLFAFSFFAILYFFGCFYKEQRRKTQRPI